VSKDGGVADVLQRFSEPTRTWFGAAFAEPTPAQVGAWEAIGAGRHALVVAPTGSGTRKSVRVSTCPDRERSSSRAAR
jgi:hypothetical protein